MRKMLHIFILNSKHRLVIPYLFFVVYVSVESAGCEAVYDKAQLGTAEGSSGGDAIHTPAGYAK